MVNLFCCTVLVCCLKQRRKGAKGVMLGVFFCYHEIHEKDTNKKSFLEWLRYLRHIRCSALKTKSAVLQIIDRITGLTE